MPSQKNSTPSGEILFYQTKDGGTRIDVRLQDETVWLTQAQMAELFQTTKQNVSLHVKNVFEEGELDQKATVKESLTVQKEGDRRVSREVSYYATKPNMGLTSWSGSKLARADIEVAKNYLSQDELDVLNRFVSMYLDYAELQAMGRKSMYMKDWIAKLDDFIQFNERALLAHAGKMSHQQAIEKAPSLRHSCDKSCDTVTTNLARLLRHAQNPHSQLRNRSIIYPNNTRGMLSFNTEFSAGKGEIMLN